MFIRTHKVKSATTELTICPIGDVQWAGDEEDIAYDLLEEHIDLCLASPNPLFIGTGDYSDFASPSMRKALENVNYDTARRVIVDKSKALVDDLYQRLLKRTRGKWGGITQGHHHHLVKMEETRKGEVITEDSDVYLAKLLGAPWLDEMGVVKIVFPGGGVFRLLVFHGSGNSVFPWGPLIKQYRLMPHFHVDLILMGHQCLPTRARILTRSGFRRHDEVAVGDEVLAYDLGAGTSKWTRLQGVMVYRNAPMLTARSKSLWLEMTPGHQLVVRSPAGVERLAPLDEVKHWERLITTAVAEPGPSAMTTREAAILGWLVTDGHMGIRWRSPNFQIGQRNPVHVEALRALLGADATEHPRASGMRYFYLRAPLARALMAYLPSKAQLPSLVTQLSRSSRQAMLAAMLAAEGDGVRTFSHQPGPVLDAFLILAALEGHRVGRLKSSPSGFPSRTSTRRRARILSRHAGAQTVSYLAVAPAEPGDAWCPTTAFGTWVTELDGQVFITGNTKKAVGEVDRLEFPAENDDIHHMTIKMVGTGGWMKGYINGRRTYVSTAGLGPVALGQPLIHLRPRIRKGRWDPRMTVES